MKKLILSALFLGAFTFMACGGDDDSTPIQPSACDTATANAATAANALPATSDANYTTKCNDYKNALQEKITACGDSTGSIQIIIDGLGNCSGAIPTACDTATSAAATAQTNFNNATSANYTMMCNDYKNALQNKITECGDTSGDIQAIIDGLGNCVAPKTYTADVAPIFSSNCLGCHGSTPSNGAPSSFHTYDLVKAGVQNGNILNRINNTGNPMPPNGLMSTANRAIIQQWMDDGFLQN